MKTWKFKNIKCEGPNNGKRFIRFKKSGVIINIHKHDGDVFLIQCIDQHGDFVQDVEAHEIDQFLLDNITNSNELDIPTVNDYLQNMDDVDVGEEF